jgi:hypothetical protein
MQQRTKSITSLVLGVLSIVGMWTGPIGLAMGIVAIVFSSKGLKQGQDLRGLAIAGLVTAIIGVILSFIYTMIYLLAIILFFSSLPLI